ncbi:50S ribosomal protein L25/general stress protein Ctc [Trichocoleus sp. FACHB-591]|uniref:50S ribosomal protein L25/general stress protein Ctc n=1 Tax=Trichocoleus TaxID=450526 RepID=UPI0016890B4E|nr:MULTISPECIES: 50S ribosomal protein L25/general stress protein Ctc [unclassified Trichocoleus]MBD2098501.1 50S ribosomal protein L25/general stress protein Ctc [Trichocoleus sp. FACHB-591]MBD2124088.1 50S ribosomal protein L25/general stress protein Ctc [Trichocoleus sp. FACHB-262]
MLLNLECQKRESGTKPGALRRAGKTPAVLYGHKGAESISLTLDAKVAESLVDKATLNNTLVQLSIPSLGWSGKTLLREVQTHAWKPSIYHLSFFAIESQSSIHVQVPIHPTGEAPGVKLEQGSLDTVLTEVQIQCPPGSIPDFIEVDISELHVGDMVHISDLKLPDGAVALEDPAQVVMIVIGPRSTAAAEQDEATTTESAAAT